MALRYIWFFMKRGKVDAHGFFEILEHIFAGLPPQKPLKQVMMKRRYMAIVSGIEFGENEDRTSIELLKQFIVGNAGNFDV